LFDCKSTAEGYKEFLMEDDGFDYVKMDIREVCMESAFATA